jgi:hypothetical protein
VIRGYEVTLMNEVDGGTSSFTLRGNETSMEFQDLHPAYTYVLKISAETVRQGPFSHPVRVTMAEDGEHKCIHVHVSGCLE